MTAEALQGEGTYTYACRKHDCEHCRLMGLSPEPELIVEEEITEIIVEEGKKAYKLPKRCAAWTGRENRILIDNRHKMAEIIVKLLPGRSVRAINTHATRLKKIGML